MAKHLKKNPSMPILGYGIFVLILWHCQQGAQLQGSTI
jgi:hypothetical protein